MSERDVIFRENFLCRFQDPDERESLQRFGGLLLDLAAGAERVEAGRSGMTTSALYAAAADLRRLSFYFRTVAEEVAGCEVSAQEAGLGVLAKGWAGQVGDLANAIEGEVEETEAESLEPAEEAARVLKLTEGVRRLLGEAGKLPDSAADGAVGQLAGHLRDALDGLEAEP